MNKKGKIIDVCCPHCLDPMYKRKSQEFLSIEWVCGNCVYVYANEWFNLFSQFEHLVLREKDDYINYNTEINKLRKHEK